MNIQKVWSSRLYNRGTFRPACRRLRVIEYTHIHLSILLLSAQVSVCNGWRHKRWRHRGVTSQKQYRFPGHFQILRYFSNKIYGNNFIRQHSETVMVWNYQSDDCSLRKKISCHFIIIFGTVSFPIVAFAWTACELWTVLTCTLRVLQSCGRLCKASVFSWSQAYWLFSYLHCK